MLAYSDADDTGKLRDAATLVAGAASLVCGGCCEEDPELSLVRPAMDAYEANLVVLVLLALSPAPELAVVELLGGAVEVSGPLLLAWLLPSREAAALCSVPLVPLSGPMPEPPLKRENDDPRADIGAEALDEPRSDEVVERGGSELSPTLFPMCAPAVSMVVVGAALLAGRNAAGMLSLLPPATEDAAEPGPWKSAALAGWKETD